MSQNFQPGAVSSSLALLSGAMTINAIGHSIPAQSRYQYSAQPSAFGTIPAWVPSFNYTQSGYGAGYVVQNGGYLYALTTAGTSASSGGPLTYGTGITDGSCVWKHLNEFVSKPSTSYLFWAEAFAQGRLRFNLSDGYGGPKFPGINNAIVKLIVQTGGSNYTAPTLSLGGGASCTLQTTNGVITGATLINPGQNYSGSITVSPSDATGSGAAITVVTTPSGTFGIPGAHAADALACLADAKASAANIIVVDIDTNSILAAESLSSILSANQVICEQLMNAGKKVVLMATAPRYQFTAAQANVAMRVNEWKRAYCNQAAAANPSGYSQIALADATGYMTDQTNLTLFYPVGGAGGVANAMTQDGVHPSPRAAMYEGYAIYLASQQWIAPPPGLTALPRMAGFGYDYNLNPSGNLLEGYPWQASYNYQILGQRCANGGNIYRLTATGTSASSGGPTGTGTAITDGTATWRWVGVSGLSIGLGGVAGAFNTMASITTSGGIPAGTVFYRPSGGGSTTGSITGSAENPWSNGQIGGRQKFVFANLAGGASNELFSWNIWNGALGSPPNFPINLPSDANSSKYFFEAEIELSGVVNMTQISLSGLSDSNEQFSNQCGNYFGTLGAGCQLMQSSGEMIAIPNNGRIYLRTEPMYLPANMANAGAFIQFGFDASSGSSNGATVYINHLSIKRDGVY